MSVPLYVLFASATGNAEEISKRIHENNLTKKYPSKLFSLNDFKDKILAKKTDTDPYNMIIVASSTGNGDVPENGDKFWRFIKRTTTPATLFAGVNYGVLGLGDTNYDKFCFASKQIDKRVGELGGVKYCHHGAADDATGLEEVVEPWIDQLSIHLDKLYPSKQQAPTQNKSEEPVEENTKLPNSCFVKVTLTQGTVQPSLRSPPSPIHRSYDVNTPYHARMIGARYLTTSGSEKQVLHVELDLGNSGITYAPGDAIGILPENDPEMVDELLKRLNLFEQKDHFINTECSDAEKLSLYPKHLNVCQDDRRVTVRELFLKYIDLSATVNTTTIRALADHCTDRMQRQDLLMLSSPSVNPTAYRVQIQHQSANILDMLKWYPSCQPPLNKILQVSQPMRPRYYSIACSPLRHPNHVHIAFTLVKFETPPPYRLEKHGCCTRWLGKRVQDFLTRDPRVYVPMFLKNTPEFRLPSDVETPMILIGPGTGVAPFRSFLQHRECVLNARVDRDTFTSQDWRGKNKADSNWLFYGCRSRDLDFLYRQDLRNFERDSPVALNLLVASSREADCSGGMWYGGMYVQDYLKEYSGTILELMQKHGGFLYVCGDAHGMAKDVHRVLRGLIEDELGLETEQAEQIISKWENDGRYQKDVW